MIRRVFQTDGELTVFGRKIVIIMARVYALAICLMCFLPQNWYANPKGFQTPGIIQVGRLYLLLTPFNSFVNADKLDNLLDFFWVLLQNITNIFLIFPLVLCLLFLRAEWRSWKIVMRNSFYISLFIECTQLLLDVLIDAQRVFEIDDLWTNTLGGLLAYSSYLLVKKWISKKG